VIALYVALEWWRRRSSWQPATVARDAGLAIIVGVISLWAFTLFDISRPFVPRSFAAEHAALSEAMARPLPAGVYLKSLAGGMTHAAEGHPGYLFGEVRLTGWWYYFPVVATYKVPIVIGLLGLLALASLWPVRARWEELALFLPLLGWLTFMMCSRINIGFRHLLPAYVYALLLATRFLAAPARGWRIAAAVAITLLAIESPIHHPNYLGYINFPHRKPHLAINDSNIDWGQSLKQIRRWLDDNPQTKRVYLRYFGRPNSPSIQHYLGDRVEALNLDHRPPVSGILIISPYWEAGVGDAADRYRLLRPATPIAIIGDSMLVYDLDRVKGWRAAHRRRQ
jgi:hypothetical protein